MKKIIPPPPPSLSLGGIRGHIFVSKEHRKKGLYTAMSSEIQNRAVRNKEVMLIESFHSSIAADPHYEDIGLSHIIYIHKPASKWS